VHLATFDIELHEPHVLTHSIRQADGVHILVHVCIQVLDVYIGSLAKRALPSIEQTVRLHAEIVHDSHPFAAPVNCSVVQSNAVLKMVESDALLSEHPVFPHRLEPNHTHSLRCCYDAHTSNVETHVNQQLVFLHCSYLRAFKDLGAQPSR
jgi:hypothetical protein